MHSMFLADLVFVVEVVIVSLGFVAFHFAEKNSSGHLKRAGQVLLVGGILAMLCTGYFVTKYWLGGHYDMPFAAQMMMRQ